MPRISFSAIIGLLLGGVVMFYSLHETDMPMMYFINVHGIVTVLGGTMTVMLIAFPLPTIFSLLKIFFLRVLGRNKVDYHGTIEQILELSKKATVGLAALNESIPAIKHPFLKEAVTLVGGGVLTDRELRDVLEKRVKTTETGLMHEANMFKTLGRFPPAFGLLATTLGMIALLKSLGQPGSEKLIGPAMSIGLIGTLYGIAFSNLVLLPIGETLTERTREEIVLRKIIVEGATLLKAQVNPITLRESLNSYLLPKERVVRKAAA